MKSTTSSTVSKKSVPGAKNLTSNLSMLAIGKKLQEIKNNAGSQNMSEWNLSLFKHLR